MVRKDSKAQSSTSSASKLSNHAAESSSPTIEELSSEKLFQDTNRGFQARAQANCSGIARQFGSEGQRSKNEFRSRQEIP